MHKLVSRFLSLLFVLLIIGWVKGMLTPEPSYKTSGQYKTPTYQTISPSLTKEKLTIPSVESRRVIPTTRISTPPVLTTPSIDVEKTVGKINEQSKILRDLNKPTISAPSIKIQPTR